MASTWKTVRVFISSTFRDMHAERDWLVKVVFPALRERLERYRIHLVDIDLRWGVTQVQADNDQALDVCLDQIDECRPFFVGILGERYGFVPETFNEQALSKFGWIQHQTGKSITELEILYGVLRKHEMRSRAFFYFRDKSFINQVPPAKSGDVRAESDHAAEQLVRLKQEIHDADLPTPPVEYRCQYRGLKLNWRLVGAELGEVDRQTLAQIAGDGIVDLKEYAGLNPRLREFVDRHGVVDLDGLEDFGRRVEEQLWHAIQTEHNLPDVPPSITLAEVDPLAEEADYHERFMESRLRVYVGRVRDRRDLRRFADGDDEVVCLVTGAPGSGKSALLAKFVTDYREDHPDAVVIPHFVGASPASTNLWGMLRRLCGELRARFGFQLPIPDRDEELPVTFRTYLTLVPETTQLVLAIDALNQLEVAQQARELHWLSEMLPTHVKVILSCTTPTSPDAAAETILSRLGERMVFAVDVHPLSIEERFEIVHRVPSLSAKALDAQQIGLLLANPATANPLFLLVALEELRCFGSYEQLDARIAALPREGDTLTAVFIQVIERLQDDFGGELTGAVLTLLAAARRGLSERELEELLLPSPPAARLRSPKSGEGLRVPENLFPLLRQLRPYLLQRGDLLNFYHQSLGLAIGEHYFCAPERKAATHRTLADYFKRQNLTPRQVEEFPWQLCEAHAWQRLFELLSVLPFLKTAWNASKWDIKTYWSRVESDSPLHMVDAYRPVLNAPERYPHDAVWTTALLLQQAGHPEEAFTLQTYFVNRFREIGDHANLAASLGNQAVILQARGELDEALRLNKEEEQICRELGNKDGLSISLGNQATIHKARGELDEAMQLHKEVERICRERGNMDGLSASLGGQSLILKARGELDEAMRLHKEEERICRERGNKDGLSYSLGNQAVILQARGELDEALRLHKDQERICRELGNKDGLSISLGNQAVILQGRGELDEALRLLKDQERICRELGSKDGLQRTLGNQAGIFYARGELDEAMQLFKEKERICRELGNKDGLSISLGNQAVILQGRGELDEALRLHKDQERICREQGNVEGLALSLANQASLLAGRMNRVNEADPLALEAFRLANQHGLAALAQQIKPILDAVILRTIHSVDT